MARNYLDALCALSLDGGDEQSYKLWQQQWQWRWTGSK